MDEDCDGRIAWFKSVVSVHGYLACVINCALTEDRIIAQR